MTQTIIDELARYFTKKLGVPEILYGTDRFRIIGVLSDYGNNQEHDYDIEFIYEVKSKDAMGGKQWKTIDHIDYAFEDFITEVVLEYLRAHPPTPNITKPKPAVAKAVKKAKKKIASKKSVSK